MRVREGNKKEAIFEATLRLITERGFHNTPTSLIAKEAGVAAGTLYLYFESKEALLNQLYMKVKKEVAAGLMAGYTSDLTLQEALELVWRNGLAYGFTSPLAFQFMEQFENSPLLDEEAIEAGSTSFQPLYNLMVEARTRKVIKDVDNFLLYALFFQPAGHFVKHHLRYQTRPSEEMITTLFQGCWDAIKR